MQFKQQPTGRSESEGPTHIAYFCKVDIAQNISCTF